MKAPGRRLVLIWILLIIGAALVIGWHLVNRQEEAAEELNSEREEGKYKIGNIKVATTGKGEIQLDGRVSKDRGWVQFLIHLHGYKWLKEESAIVSEAKLADLQRAIALLDWRIWDELWHGKDKSRRLDVFLKWNEKEIRAQDLVRAEDALRIEDLVFLGSPYFDHIALEAPPGMDCRLCPVFPLEQKALKESFIRESGRSGYELNPEILPDPNTKVTIIIRLKNETGSMR